MKSRIGSSAFGHRNGPGRRNGNDISVSFVCRLDGAVIAADNKSRRDFRRSSIHGDRLPAPVKPDRDRKYEIIAYYSDAGDRGKRNSSYFGVFERPVLVKIGQKIKRSRVFYGDPRHIIKVPGSSFHRIKTRALKTDFELAGEILSGQTGFRFTELRDGKGYQYCCNNHNYQYFYDRDTTLRI